MRISISGTGNQGKTTLINDFLQKWPSFKRESQTYRDIIAEKKHPHSKHATKEGQWDILNAMLDEMQRHPKGDKIIYDRCPLDNLVYSLWKFERGDGDIDKDFIDKCIPIVRESLRQLDIIFFIPITKFNDIKIVDDGMREADPVYIKEIDNIFKGIQRYYLESPQNNPFFPTDDSPALIEIFGSREERIEMIKLYIDTDGDLIGGETGIADIFSPENMSQMEELLKSQQDTLKSEKQIQKELADIKNFLKHNKL